MKSSAHGLVIGSFYPPHAGHELLIRTAAQLCERVSVIVMAASHETIPLATRVGWLREIHSDARHVHVTGVIDDVALDHGNATQWDQHVELMHRGLRTLGAPPVATVFTSEPYGAELARRFHAMPVTLDTGRSHVQVSGTRVRADLAAHWDMLATPVRRDLALRVVVVGAESSGSTTLAHAITDTLRKRGGAHALTRVVPDFGRTYSVRKHATAIARAQLEGKAAPAFSELVWDTAEFVEIARQQRRIEREQAAFGGAVLVCDTDPLATGIWHERYLGAGESDVDALARPFGDLYIVTHHEGVPFVQDAIRDGERLRDWMTTRFIERLTSLRLPHVVVAGPHESRLARAVEAVAAAQRHAWQFAVPTGSAR
ncbi:AAA family ATPase [Caenimonas koreensis]|uniref:AAA family ATPase n=1 Tax=Caenimonas koreensis DSM 17982 TaxID=1121255 RepID=A0A844B389_9BURK|nr:AAA family ATPase [Caenimonas koreensis]MRD49228.1 AAA family ATPase [Caenimonas koreensis DSM 17982]